MQNIWERLAAQLLGVAIIAMITLVGCFLMYGVLFVIPIKIRTNSKSCWNDFITR